ncbi:sodium pump decarboxylase subunit gamma [Pseudoclostridium thermosuccinogenes]|uniref:sodium pump decarboxylase subunit gamma n=1 Tax=Clostridium thermosuccinogenes TaxID=84032 RepID=UPI000CCBDA7F|nr:sodium pump decarboxylase subunit gamma [Pseudoclostridium thermosuccinogenes]
MHDENEILAVISAAVAMLNATPEVKLVVRSYRRVNQTSPVWNTIGREEIVSSRL